MEFKNKKPLSEIQREKELSKMPIGDAHLILSQLNANVSAFIDYYFGQFPDQE